MQKINMKGEEFKEPVPQKEEFMRVLRYVIEEPVIPEEGFIKALPYIEKANLGGADLSRTYLRGADLSRTYLL